MTTKQYLKQIAKLEKKIENRISELNKLKGITYSAPGVGYGENIRAGMSDPTGKGAVKITSDEKDLQGIIDECRRKRQCIIEQIESLDDDVCVDVLYLRYVLRAEWYDIAEKTKLSQSWIFTKHRQGLQDFEKKFGNLYLKSDKS